MARRTVTATVPALVFLAMLIPAASGKPPPPHPEPSVVLTLSCDWEPVPEGDFPPLPYPHLDARVAWTEIGNRAELSVAAGELMEGVRREWGGYVETIRREQSGTRDLHLDVGIAPGDRMWGTATITKGEGVVARADVSIDC
jgi:hypothetical protein